MLVSRLEQNGTHREVVFRYIVVAQIQVVSLALSSQQKRSISVHTLYFTVTHRHRCAVALSGSIPSAVLLDLLHRTQHQTRMVMHPIHIDTSNVYKATEEARKERIQQVKQIGAKYNQNVEIYPIEDFFPLESLQSAMKSLKTNTSKEDFMSYVVKQALVVVAKSKKCNKLIVSSNGTNLAVKFMTSFCKGNGYQATQLISYATELDSGVCSHKLHPTHSPVDTLAAYARLPRRQGDCAVLLCE